MKKILSMILAIAMVLTTMGTVAFAEETAVASACGCSTSTTWDGTVCEHWYDNANKLSAYEISTAAQLAGLANIVYTAKYSNDGFNGVKFTLENDIDLNSIEWLPIGAQTNDRGSFKASFDGKNHVISNLVITKSYEKGTGLFGYVTNYNAVIENLTVENATVGANGSYYVGAVIGNAAKATVKNVSVTGVLDIKGYNGVAGLIGYGYPVIEDCALEASGVIDGYYATGGIIGNFGASAGVTSIKDCAVIGTDAGLTMIAEYGAIGAVCGINRVGTTGSGLYAENVVLETEDKSSVSYVSGGVAFEDFSFKNVVAEVNGVEVVPTDVVAVASIGDVNYGSLQAAVNAAQAGDTVLLLGNYSDTTGTLIDKDVEIDLNGYTYTSTGSSNTSSRNFKITGDANVVIKNGTIIADGDVVDITASAAAAGSGAYGSVRMESTGNLEMTDITTFNYRPWGLNIKLLNGNTTLNRVKIFGSYGGGVEAGGNATLNDCEIYVDGVFPYAAYTSAAFSVCSGATLNINGGTYATSSVGGADNARGSYCGGVNDSGGTLNIYDGTFSNGRLDDGTVVSNPLTVLYTDAKTGAESYTNIYGGTFNAFEGSTIGQWNSSYLFGTALTTIYGGNFNIDPINGMTSIIKVADGYKLAQYADGSYIVVDAAYIDVNEIEVTLKEAMVKEDEVTYDIVLTAADSKVINRLNSADLSFVLTQVNGTNEYEILASNDEVTINKVSDDRYEFHYAGKDDADTDTAKSITIGQVKFTGVGTFSFAVDTSANETNAVHATEILDSIVDTFIPNGDVANGEGKLTLINATTGELTMEVPTRDLEVQIDFNNAAEKNTIEYQDMTVVVSGGDLEEDITINLGDTTYTTDVEIFGKSAAQYTVDASADNKYVVTVAGALTSERTYTVTVSGAGYRTVRKNITMNEDATVDNVLTYWNNVKDADGADYLAGDIVKDNTINVYDLSAVVSYFGRTNNTSAYSKYARYDLNRDGKIDSKDVAYVLVSWGK